VWSSLSHSVSHCPYIYIYFIYINIYRLCCRLVSRYTYTYIYISLSLSRFLSHSLTLSLYIYFYVGFLKTSSCLQYGNHVLYIYIVIYMYACIFIYTHIHTYIYSDAARDRTCTARAVVRLCGCAVNSPHYRTCGEKNYDTYGMSRRVYATLAFCKLCSLAAIFIHRCSNQYEI